MVPTATSRSSPTPFTIGVFAFRGNRTHVPGDKYMSNPFPLPICNSPGPTMVPTATSRSSPTPFTIGVFAFRGNRTHVPGDKYMSNPFPLPIELLAQLVVGMDWTCTYPQVHGFDSHERQKLQ
ncbi:hypothetical protein QL285_039763 [Trifolium repens]|nr:hypothetical protein QL285_039763 [Trifolium repens]